MDEKQLLQHIQNDATREAAFRSLIGTYQERLYWHVRRIVLNHDDTDDVLQNTFIKVWKGLKTFRGESGLYTWLYRIATNESITHLNQKKKQSVFATGETSDFLLENMKADSYFDGDKALEQLQVAIARLPDKQRLVFNMKYFDELKFTEISEVLDTSVGALKASYHHAVKKLEVYITEESEDLTH